MIPFFVPGYLSFWEGVYLFTLGRQATYPIVEIGSWRGRSTCFLAWGSSHGYGVPVVAIDTWQGSEEHHGLKELETLEEAFDENIRECGFEHMIRKKKGDSQEVKIDDIGWIGLLFIDGAHDYNSVRADFERFSPLVKPGGIIAFHDVADYAPEVKRFVRQDLPGGYERMRQVNSLAAFRVRHC